MSCPPPDDDRTQRSAGDALLALADVMSRLRADGGCPWDREQDLHTLRPYLIEEAHEVLETLDRLSPDGAGPWQEHRDELGDLLFQVVFQSEIQREAGRFDVGDVARAIHDKLVRRHPHVFEGKAREPGSWERIKAEERAAKGEAPRTSALDGVPAGLPALQRAYRLGKKANAVGFDWPDPSGVVEKIHEELGELEEALASGDPESALAKAGTVAASINPQAGAARRDPRFDVGRQHVLNAFTGRRRFELRQHPFPDFCGVLGRRRRARILPLAEIRQIREHWGVEGGLIALHRMLGRKEMPARLHVGDGAKGHVVIILRDGIA